MTRLSGTIYLCIFINSMLEGTTNRILCLKESCLNWLCAREEDMGSNKGLQSNQARRTSSNDGDTYNVLYLVRVGAFDLVKEEASNEQTKNQVTTA
jgi:hypothetical protein